MAKTAKVTSSNPINDAFQEIDGDNRRRDAEDEAYTANRWREYGIVLARMENPHKGDKDFLTHFAREFDFTIEGMKNHANCVKRAKVEWERRLARQENHRKMIEAREHFHATEKRCQQEVDEAERAFNFANNEHRISALAESGLAYLRRQRPEFFEMRDGVTVPVWIRNLEQ